MKRVILIATLIVAATSLLLIRPVLWDTWRKCPCTIMYCTSVRFPEMDVVRIFNERVGAKDYVRARTLSESLKLKGATPLGYDPGSKSWIFANVEPNSTSSVITSNQLLLYRKSGFVPVTLRGLPSDADIREAKLLKNRVFVPCVLGGELTLYCYTISGTLLSTRVLKVPNSHMEHEAGASIAVSDSGVIGALIWLDHAADEDGNYIIFDRGGRILRRLNGSGSDAQLSYDGSKMAYFSDDNLIVILDVRSGQRKFIKVWPLADGRPWDLVNAPLSFLWDSHRNWIVVAYENQFGLGYQPVYAADISGARPRWKRLPIKLDSSYWALLDEPPK